MYTTSLFSLEQGLIHYKCLRRADLCQILTVSKALLALKYWHPWCPFYGVTAKMLRLLSPRSNYKPVLLPLLFAVVCMILQPAAPSAAERHVCNESWHRLRGVALTSADMDAKHRSDKQESELDHHIAGLFHVLGGPVGHAGWPVAQNFPLGALRLASLLSRGRLVPYPIQRYGNLATRSSNTVVRHYARR
jgi:hypothetical protein